MSKKILTGHRNSVRVGNTASELSFEGFLV